jgi:ribosomal-protein-alanine N-acetyltransferase
MIDPSTLLSDPPTITTARLTLRVVRVNDAEQLFETFRDAEAMRYWSSPPHESPAVTAEMLERARASFLAGEGIEFAMMPRGEERVIGKVGHWRWQKAHSRSEIGFILRRDLWRQGLATEALRAAVEWGFAKLELHSVEAQLDAGNLGSARTLERAGFVREGVLRQSYWDGKEFRDTAMYGLLRSEYLPDRR